MQISARVAIAQALLSKMSQISLVRGEDYSFYLLIIDDSTAQGADYSGASQVELLVVNNDGSFSLMNITGTQIVAENAAVGLFKVNVPKAMSAVFNDGMELDMQLTATDPSGEVSRSIIMGKLNVTPQLTGPVVAPIIPTSGFATYGFPSAPQIVNPVVGLVVTSDPRQAHFIASSGGAQPVTADPQIGDGSIIGDELVIFGTSDVNYITFHDGDGLSLNGSWDSTSNATLYLLWNGTVWEEIARR